MNLDIADSGAVRIISIDRPDRLNAIDGDTAHAIEDAIRTADGDRGVGAVVLRGVGEHFSAGGDAHSILDTVADPDPRTKLDMMRTFHRMVEEIWNASVPVIAAVSGVAYGGGFSLALACDMIVSAPGSRFCHVFLRRGVVPDVGAAWLLPRVVGLHRAKELMLLASEITAARALDVGIVNEIADDPYVRALEIAATLADGPALATGLTKRLVNASAATDLHAALGLEAVTQTLALQGDDAQSMFQAFLGKDAR